MINTVRQALLSIEGVIAQRRDQITQTDIKERITTITSLPPLLITIINHLVLAALPLVDNINSSIGTRDNCSWTNSTGSDAQCPWNLQLTDLSTAVSFRRQV